MLRSLNNLGLQARQVPAFAWMALYLILIPVFGLAFWLCGPTGFSHGTRSLEAQYEAETRELQRDIRQEFLANHTSIISIDTENMRFAPLSCRFDLRSASAQGSELRIPFFIGAARGKNDPRFGFIIDEEAEPVEVQADLLFTSQTQAIDEDWVYQELRVDGEVPAGIDLSPLFPKKPDNVEEGSLYFRMGRWTSERLTGRRRELLGFSGSTAGGDIITMMYFSAVTITTLGYGDIAPVTTTTRVLTATEAVLGLVVIGLFLNSVGGPACQLASNVDGAANGADQEAGL